MTAQSTPFTRRICVSGFAATVAVTALSVTQNLVLNPLASAPGRSLAQIRADVAAAGESLDAPLVLGIAALYLVAGVVMLAEHLRRPRPSWRSPASAFLLLLAFAAPMHWFTSFGPGIALADTYQISGATHSPWGWPVYLISLASLAGLIVLVPARTFRPPPGSVEPLRPADSR
ncbi:hypothetical protein AAEX63_12185 [Luteococcus sp. H138]|uniref:hypothetical protein n=1 Tax=unclassified Luteococcus TaxID=2639923 RepID=UPI00313B1793